MHQKECSLPSTSHSTDKSSKSTHHTTTTTTTAPERSINDAECNYICYENSITTWLFRQIRGHANISIVDADLFWQEFICNQGSQIFAGDRPINDFVCHRPKCYDSHLQSRDYYYENCCQGHDGEDQ
jgi:hypothetical protein